MAKSERFIRKTHGLLDSVVYRSLHPASRDILDLFLKKYHPNNRGIGLILTYDEVHSHFGFSFQLIAKCFKDLLRSGYIILEHRGSFGHDPSTYTLNLRLLGLRIKGD